MCDCIYFIQILSNQSFKLHFRVTTRTDISVIVCISIAFFVLSYNNNNNNNNNFIFYSSCHVINQYKFL